MKTILIIITIILLIKYVIPYLRRQIKLYQTIKVVKTYINGMTEELNSSFKQDTFIVPDIQNLHKKYNKNVVRGKNGRFKSKNEING
jgi:hypothetical protein